MYVYQLLFGHHWLWGEAVGNYIDFSSKSTYQSNIVSQSFESTFSGKSWLVLDVIKEKIIYTKIWGYKLWFALRLEEKFFEEVKIYMSIEKAVSIWLGTQAS